MFEIDFHTFNLLEGIFWIALSFVVVFYSYNELPDRYRFLSAYTATTLFIFGLTDFLENYVGSFLTHGNQWLFVLKALIVLAQVVAIFMFIRMRMKEGDDAALV